MTHLRVILHADMDAFFAAVEQRDRPELRGRPVIVGGRSARGVVAAASYEARRFGVHSAMPTAEARKLCPQGVFLQGNMRRYQRESRRIFEIFARYSPMVEGLSIDEAFLDLTGTERLLGKPHDVGERLRKEVFQATQLTVSVGIAPVKMVAKIASDEAKPDGLREVKPDAVRAFLDPLPVQRIWGVGPVAARKLHALGFRSIGDLAHADATRLKYFLGDWGLALQRLALGDDLREVEAYREPVSYGEENTFERDISDGEMLRAALRVHSEAVARRLRHDGVVARTLTLKVKLAQRTGPGQRGFPQMTRQRTLSEGTNDGATIYANMCLLCDALSLKERVRLVGVSVSGLEAEAREQLGLFRDDLPNQRRKKLNRTLDAIQDRFGQGAIAHGVTSAASRAGLSTRIKRGDDDE